MATKKARMLSSVDATIIYFSITHSPCVEVTHRPTSSMATTMGATAFQKHQNDAGRFVLNHSGSPLNVMCLSSTHITQATHIYTHVHTERRVCSSPSFTAKPCLLMFWSLINYWRLGRTLVKVRTEQPLYTNINIYQLCRQLHDSMDSCRTYYSYPLTVNWVE